MFKLSKWYTDCVSDAGAAFIGYWARMRWGPLIIPYAATLFRPARGVTRERYSIRGCTAPAPGNGALRWDCRRLDLSGTWTTRQPVIRRTLLDTAEGSIIWTCHVPAGDARIELAGAIAHSGLGYAERLDLTVKPWRLPFDELRWGRFLSGADAVTWIEWRGGESRRWAFHNGAELAGVAASNARIELADDYGRIELADAVPLREGRLGSTALRPLPGRSVWLPAGIRKAHEAKWLARGTFSTKTRSSSGWVIHEVVRLR